MIILAGVFVALSPTPQGPTAPVYVDGKRKAFLLDTGSSRTVLPQSVAGEPIRMVTAGETITASKASGIRLEFAGRHQNEAVFYPPLRAFLSRRIHGVLGNDLTLQSALRIDGPNQRIELDAEGGQGEEFALQMRQGTPIARVILQIPGKVALPIEALVDTGSDQGLLLTRRCLDDLDMRPEGASNFVQTAAGRVATRELGVVGIGSSERKWQTPARALEGGTHQIDAIIGWSFLKDRVTLIDPLRGKLWMK